MVQALPSKSQGEDGSSAGAFFYPVRIHPTDQDHVYSLVPDIDTPTDVDASKQ